MSKPEDKYFEGFNMTVLTHIPDVSSYNRNFYKFDTDLLFAKSDDDNTTEWYLVRGEDSHYLGYTYTSEGDRYLYKGMNS